MIAEPAPAKVNLALHVRRLRPDGYRDIETLFAFARDGDALTAAPADRDVLELAGFFAPALVGTDPADNLVLRAASAFRARFGGPPGYEFRLDKHLPVASGIGGGSADAAAALRALARLNGISPADPALFEVAAALGADVPACLLGRAAEGTGRGDVLLPVGDGLAGAPMLLINPGIAVSTAAVFAGWDGEDRGPLAADPDPFARALAGRNDLEAPARALAPVIGEVLDLLAAAPGLRLARMSGSGATCFALTEHPVPGVAAAARARGWWALETALA